MLIQPIHKSITITSYFVSAALNEQVITIVSVLFVFSLKLNLRDERNLVSTSSKSYSDRRPTYKKMKRLARRIWWRLRHLYERLSAC